jgi:hypothetical protein
MIAARMVVDTGTGITYEVESAGGYHEHAVPLFSRALEYEFGLLNGKRGGEVLLELFVASARIRLDQDDYSTMLPENTWATARGAAEYLSLLARMCGRHLRAVLELHDANQ